MRLLSKGMVAVACATLFVQAGARAEGTTLITIQSGHSVVLPAANLTRVAVGDSKIAGVVPLGTSQVVVNGKSPGHTTIFVWSDSERTTYEVTVTEQVGDDFAQALRTEIREPKVTITTAAGTIIVRGTVPTEAAFDKITDTIGRFQKAADANKTTIVNAVVVSDPLAGLMHQIAALPNAESVHPEFDLKGNLVISGHVPDRITAEKILDYVRGMSGSQLPVATKIIDRMTTSDTTEVDIKCYVLEVDRTAQQQLGLRLQAATFNLQNTTATYTLGDPQIVGVENPVGNGKIFNAGSFFRNVTLAPTLDLILTSGHAKILSSPDLTTMPGKEATFLVGGQLPIPFPSGNGAVSIEFKDYGIRLDVTPRLLGNGGFMTHIAPEVSSLDFAHAITFAGYTLPAIATSKLETEVFTQPGESIVLGGLVQHVENRTFTKIPALGDLPVLGALFRSNSFQKNDTDVVFVMTPELITR